MFYLILKDIKMLKRFRQYIRENMMDNPYGKIEPKFNEKLTVTVVKPDEWYESPFEFDDLYGEGVKIVPLTRRLNIQNGEIDYDDISQFGNLDDVIRYVRRKSKCVNIYGVERYEHGLSRYSLINIGDKLSDRWDSALVGLIYSPKGEYHLDKEQLSSFLSNEFTDWANGDNMYMYDAYEVYEDKLKEAVKSNFRDYEPVDTLSSIYCSNYGDIFKYINSEIESDIIILGKEMYHSGIYDKDGNEIKL